MIWQSKVGLLLKLIESTKNEELKLRAFALVGDVKWDDALVLADAAIEAVVKSGMVHEKVASALEQQLNEPTRLQDVANAIREMVKEERWRPRTG